MLALNSHTTSSSESLTNLSHTLTRVCRVVLAYRACVDDR